MMSRQKLHVVRSPQGTWQVKPEGAGRPVAEGRTQDEAVRMAQQIAQSNRPSQVVIHRENGQIREEHTYGNDPERYPG